MARVNSKMTMTPNNVAVLVESNGSGTDAHIQTALDGLTTGRTSNEKVVLQGDFTITTAITLPSYTTLIIDGTLTVTGLNSIFSSVSKTNINIIGGTYVLPQNATINASQRFFNATGSSYININGCIVSGGGGHNISFSASCDHISVTECDLSYAGDDGISCVASSYGYFARNKIYEGRSLGTVGSTGIEIEDTSFEIICENNECHDCERGIQSVVDVGSGIVGNTDVIIKNNYCHDNTSSGIAVQYGSDTTESFYHLLDGNICTDNKSGIYLKDVNNSRVINNTVNGCVASPADGTAGVGINLSSVNYVNCSNNEVLECDGNGIQFTGTYINVTYNNLTNCGRDGVTNQYWGIRGQTNHSNCKIAFNNLTDTQGTPTMGGINTFSGTNIDVFNNHFSNLKDVASNGYGVYAQSPGGRVTVKFNTADAGDTVAMVTEYMARVEFSASPTSYAHGLTGPALNAAPVTVTSMNSNISGLSCTQDGTNVVVSGTGFGSSRYIAITSNHWERGA